MPPTLPDRAVASQANPPDLRDESRSTADDLRAAPRSTDVDLLGLIRRAIVEAGWNQEALAAAIGKDAAYISRVLSGEKPLSAAFLRALPDDIEVIVAREYATSFGLVVVAPASDDSAVQHFVGGLLALLRPQLPAAASRMAKASLSAASTTSDAPAAMPAVRRGAR